MRRLLSQQRAAFALRNVQDFTDTARNPSNERKPDKMSIHLHKTPIRILSNGLGQALAFLLSRKCRKGRHRSQGIRPAL